MYFLCLIHHHHFRADFPNGRNHDWHWNPPGQSGGWPNRYGCNNKGIMSYSATIQNRWSTCSREDQETVFKKSHYRCMVDGIGGGGGGKTIQIFFGDSSDVSFCQGVLGVLGILGVLGVLGILGALGFLGGVLGPVAGAMETRCHLDHTKELALVPGGSIGSGRSIAETSALSMLELAQTRSFCRPCQAMAMPPANLALSQEVLHL